jgi:general secretion pathway protein D
MTQARQLFERRFSSISTSIWLMLCCGFLLAGCATSNTASSLLEDRLQSKPGISSKQERLQQYLRSHEEPDPYQRSFATLGNDQLTGAPASTLSAPGDTGESNINLNLVDVPIAAAAKSVLGDTLGLNYGVDARVQGTVTVQTSRPATKSQVLAMFEGSLRGAGGSIVRSGQGFMIVPLAEATRSVSALQTQSDAGGVGQHPEIIPLRYVAADEIKDVLAPLVPEGMIVRADSTRNAIILSGTSTEIDAIRETISVFDVDWMKGMSFALVPVRSSQPAAIVQDLEQIYNTKSGPLRNIIRFIPNHRLKSVLIISSRAKYLKESTRWIEKLDALASSNEQSLHVYHVQNRTAAELATVLQSVLKSDTSSASSQGNAGGGQVAPKLEMQQAATPDANGEPTSGAETPASGLGSNDAGTADIAIADGSGASPEKAMRVVADDANNSLLVFATDQQYQRILNVLEEVDSQANQVLLEAVIAEVTLDDDMKFGVRWLIGQDKEKGTFSEVASGLIGSSVPGFSYFLKANDISFTLNALASVTDVRVLSSPSLMVLDNKTATLQVGDQVPIVTQSAQGVTTSGAPIVNNVDLKDTGVILSVTPRINDSGRVILKIRQEVSSVVKTTTSGIDSPTIRQRKIDTSVVVQDGEALALGGLIQEKETTGKSKVPVLGDIPLLGNAFRQKSNAVSRTELIIFIRPRVIRDMNDARRITKEFQQELGVRAPRVRRGETTPGNELMRILN